MSLAQKAVLARDIASRTPITIHSGTPVHVAASTMMGYNSSYLIVIDANTGNPAGIVTERDFMKLIAKNKDYYKLVIDDIMSKPLLALENNTTLVECIEFMKRKGIKHLPLVSGSTLDGVVTLKTLLMHASSPVLVQTNPIALYVLSKANGLLIFEYHFKQGTGISGDLFSGALSSFDTIFSEVLKSQGRLTFIDRENSVILIEHGDFTIHVLLQDKESIDSRKRLKLFTAEFEESFAGELACYDERTSLNVFEPAKSIIEKIFFVKVNP
nr:CBS domain-containing protein [Candidatus Sigynarchaeota archaeon]